MLKLSLTALFGAALATSVQAGGTVTDVRINELDADQTGTDSVEFIELTGPSNQALDGLFLVFYNGGDTSPVDEEYRVVELAGETMPGDGFFVIGAATVANVDFTPGFFPATNIIQNGADAVALWHDPTGLLTFSDFFDLGPSTPPAGAVLVDALVYGTNDSDDTVLIASLTPGEPQVDEDANGAKDTESIGRCPDGGTAFDSSSYQTAAPTPGGPNTCGGANAWTDLGNALGGGAGDPVLTGTGDLTDGSANSVDLTNAAASAFSGLFIGIDPNTPAAFKGGTLVPVPTFKVFFANTNGSGEILLPFVWPAGAPSAFNVYVQWAITDAGAPNGVALSNALVGTTP